MSFEKLPSSTKKGSGTWHVVRMTHTFLTQEGIITSLIHWIIKTIPLIHLRN